ncbi:MAG: aspartate/glutamate racemase family protein [Pseudomonadota bacterium]
MKTIGVIGGMSWESTELYYRRLNEAVRQRVGGLHSAPIVLHSVDFAPIEACQMAGDWDGAADILCDAARGLEAAGADFFLIATNTMHHVAKPVADAVAIPLLHLGDATARHAVDRGLTHVGLLGTRFTMEMPFYTDRLADHGLTVSTPNDEDRAIVHRVIYDELCNGVIDDTSRAHYVRVIASLAFDGADAVILGCTEIGLLVTPEHTDVPLLDTTQIHVDAAIDVALGERSLD